LGTHCTPGIVSTPTLDGNVFGNPEAARALLPRRFTTFSSAIAEICLTCSY
jgi:hypothetical protein